MGKILVIAKNLPKYFTALERLLLVSLAVWCVHIVLRVLLLFRSNPYGFPFVSKPDWFIFHAVCIDFLWIINSLILFLLLSVVLNKIWKQKNAQEYSNKVTRTDKILIFIYGIFHSFILLFTLLDNEVQRFLGCHLSFGLIDTYKDTSSLVMFWDYAAHDTSVPFLQFFVLVLMLPVAYAIYRLFLKFLVPLKIKRSIIAMACFYLMSFLFVHYIWTGNGRMTKLRPIVGLVYRELFQQTEKKTLSEQELLAYSSMYQSLWQKVEGDTLWKFPENSLKTNSPLYRIPTQALLENEDLKKRRAEKSNLIVIFMESERGLNVGCLNPALRPSPTPFIDSIAEYSHLWLRMHTSGLPTTGGVLTSHFGISDHSTLATATDLAHVSLPSFASVLTDSGYVTHYFSAADPAWDNLGVWMSKWYTAQHYNREREDDSTFFDHVIEYVSDTLSKQDKPFLATVITRSNHYPFNFAAGMPNSEKEKPLTERINYTMNYADRQVARFIRSIENKDWYKNTYVVIMADHGFPLGENGASTMKGNAFSNATWIPFLIHGKGILPMRDTRTAAQIDIAPTLLELLGFAVPNIFMGHNLLRNYGDGLSLGAYSGLSAVGFENYRLISKPAADSLWLFEEKDTHQKKNLSAQNPEKVKYLKAILDSLITLADYSLEHGI